MLASSAEIRMMPDWTVAIQLCIFLFVMIVLTVFVFNPLLKLFERRRRFTSDAAAESARLLADADGMLNQGRDDLTRALSEAHAERARKLEDARRQAEKVTQEARLKASEIVREGIARAEAKGKLADNEIERAAAELSKQIVARVVE